MVVAEQNIMFFGCHYRSDLKQNGSYLWLD